jgi:outer membrane cobalamin receptor
MKFLFVLLGSFISLFSWGQTVGIDTIQIKTVDILAPRLKHFSEAEKHQQIDSLTIVRYASQDLATLLQKVSLVNRSSNGSLGALSTVGIRGASATHTSVNWNGIPINSLTTGSADLSLISAGAFDDIEIVFGATGSLYGSGTLGGAINLSNIPSWKKQSHLNLSSEYGSFSNSKVSLAGGCSNEWISYSGQVFYRYGKNDFEYDDIYDYDSPREKLNHNENKDYGLIQDIHFNLNEHFIDVGLWYQVKNKNIAGLMGVGKPHSLQKQRDSSLKAFVGWKHLFNQFRVEAKFAYLSDNLKYTDKESAGGSYKIYSEISSQRLINEMNVRWYANDKLSFDANLKYNYLEADASAYGKTITENETKFGIVANYAPRFGKFVLSWMKDKNSEVDPPSMFAASSLIHVLPNIFDFRFKIGSHYRRPTFNERYWIPGGNIHLKSEEGWNYELGLIMLKRKVANGLMGIDLNYYRADNTNTISWQPNGSYWSPMNTGKVLSHGCELEASYNKEIFHDYQLSLTSKYAYNDAYYNDKMASNYKKELAYRPHHIVKLGGDLIHVKWNVGLLASYRSETQTYDGGKLDGNVLMDINGAYKLKIAGKSLNINGRIENIFNKSYELVKFYPMPGRAFYLGLNIKLK